MKYPTIESYVRTTNRLENSTVDQDAIIPVVSRAFSVLVYCAMNDLRTTYRQLLEYAGAADCYLSGSALGTYSKIVLDSISAYCYDMGLPIVTVLCVYARDIGSRRAGTRRDRGTPSKAGLGDMIENYRRDCPEYANASDDDIVALMIDDVTDYDWDSFVDAYGIDLPSPADADKFRFAE